MVPSPSSLRGLSPTSSECPSLTSLMGYNLINFIPTPSAKNYSDWEKLIKGVEMTHQRIKDIKNKFPILDHYHSYLEKHTMQELECTVTDLQKVLSEYKQTEERIEELNSTIDLLNRKVKALDQKNLFEQAEQINNDISALTEELFVLYEVRDSFNDSLSENHMHFAKKSQSIIALNREVLKRLASAAPAPARVLASSAAPAPANLSPTNATQTKLTTTQRLLGGKDLTRVCYTSYYFKKGEDVWLDDLNINSDEMIDLNCMWQPDPASRYSCEPKRNTRKSMSVPVPAYFNEGSAYVCYDQNRKKVFLRKSQDFAQGKIELLPGKFFILGWRVENQSNQQWSKDSRIVSHFCNHERVAQSKPVKITNEDSLPQPGYYTLVSQLYQAPEERGTYLTSWNMEDSKGRFGNPLKANVTVN